MCCYCLIAAPNPAQSVSEIEAAKSPGALFAGVEEKVAVKADALASIYQNLGRTADDLPYTPHFETLYSSYASKLETKPTRQEVWRHLLNLRKAGKLPKLGEARSRSPKVDPEAEATIAKPAWQATSASGIGCRIPNGLMRL